MRMAPGNHWHRGFTLIELLVVIGIIAVLVSLTTAAVMKLYGTGPRAHTSIEIKELERALEKFKLKHGMYPPSRIILCKNLNDYQVAYLPQYSATPALKARELELKKESLAILSKIWPNLQFPVDWDGSGSFRAAELEGDQCLVFFLGGIPSISPVGCLGFSAATPSNPAILGGDRISYFPFQQARLFRRGSHNFLSYKDPYQTDQPYLYFSSGIYGFDSRHATLGVSPFIENNGPPLKFFNHKSFQIVSAGENGLFGPGGAAWTPTNSYGGNANGKDDHANFSDLLLGVSRN